jgi:NADH:ubiquinone oxidoreductase subunit
MPRSGWKDFFLEILAWWRGNTWGTRLWARLYGKEVGSDEAGNVYFLGRDGRRMVIYNGTAEATKIPPGWHAWMHRRTDDIPAAEEYRARSWEKPHVPNMTGTARAYRPDGSLLSKGERPRVTGDYDAWSPE